MKRLLFLIPIFFTLILFSNCEIPEKELSQQELEQQKVENTIKRLSADVDLPMLDKSLERVNIKKRLELFEDENKVSYIYLVSYGKVMAFYPLKGKISSGSKRLTTNQKLVDNRHGSYDYSQYVVESPSLDGTYGSSDQYIYFWTTDGTYIQWNGEYMLADKPLKLMTPPLIVREIE